MQGLVINLSSLQNGVQYGHTVQISNVLLQFGYVDVSMLREIVISFAARRRLSSADKVAFGRLAIDAVLRRESVLFAMDLFSHDIAFQTVQYFRHDNVAFSNASDRRAASALSPCPGKACTTPVGNVTCAKSRLGQYKY